PEPRYPGNPFYAASSLEAFHRALVANETIDTALAWSWWGPLEAGDGSTRVHVHSDGYTIKFDPSALVFRNFAYAFSREQPLEFQSPPSPILFVKQLEQHLEFTWRGSLGAFYYVLEKSSDG